MSYLKELNPVQREAVQAIDGPVMIVAGAGSGKTRVLTYRAAYLVEKGVRPESILALTFTNKAAGEMKSRIITLVGESSRALWMGTFHSVFARIMRKEGERIGYDRNFTIYDTDDSLSLIKSVMNSLGVSPQQFSPQGIRARISSAKNQMISAKELRESGYDQLTERAADVFEEYQRKLRQSNAMDFDDLLLRPLDLFLQYPDVLERYQHRFKYILVDEYQDTNRVQYRLIRELASKFRNVCVVGDDAQSIYAFRGADIRNILDFEKDYPDCRVFRLEQNYRSTKTILAAAGSLIRNNVDQIAKQLWTGNDEGELVSLEVCEDDREEGRRIVARIEEETRRKKLSLKDFAVLYRTNAQSRSLEDALRRSGLPYTIVGGVAFYKRKEIKDVLAYLRLIVNPKDEESLVRVINVPARAIGETTVRRLRTLAQKHRLSLYEIIGSDHLTGALPVRTASAIRAFHGLVEKYRALRSQVSVGELARALVDDIGILHEYKDENTPESLARRENVMELVSALSEFSDERSEATLEDFLEEVSLISDVDTADFGRNAVTLMTLHSAKGLEFPVIFITGLEEGLFPLAAALESRAELEEERRLMYVGVTRAMKKLYLCTAQRRYRAGTLSFSTRSRFLDEIDQGLIEIQGMHETRPRGPERPHHEAAGWQPGAPYRRKPHTPAEVEDQFSQETLHSYEDESQDPSRLHVGAKVEHEAFGRGRVVAINGRGEQARAVVDFESVGRKQLMLKFAHLRLV
jgi:ATP-dependent DNA helicase UvrD/PcrA